MQAVRQAIKTQIHNLVGHGSSAAGPQFRTDEGLFGPESASWQVHRDFTSMMIGGVAALLLQMLHPAALAGVWDHSNFRGDMSGRLRRTAQFISGTTYGSTAQASALIARVRAIHDRVHGQLPDGRPYSANDPDLLTWIHVAEVRSFLASYLRYRDPHFSPADQDRYYAETALIAEELGAGDVPKSRSDVDLYLAAVRPELKYNRRTHVVARALLSQPAKSLAAAPFHGVLMDAGVDLLPDWAAEMHGLKLPAGRKAIARSGALGIGTAVRWALRP